MTKAEYIESLRSLLNEAAENGLSEISLQGTDTVSLDKLIEDSYRMAWDNLPLSARVSVDGATNIVPQLCEDDGPNSQVGYIELPSDYHTLVAFRMDGWKNVNSYYWVNAADGMQWASPNYLTGRMFNLKVDVKIK